MLPTSLMFLYGYISTGNGLQPFINQPRASRNEIGKLETVIRFDYGQGLMLGQLAFLPGIIGLLFALFMPEAQGTNALFYSILGLLLGVFFFVFDFFVARVPMLGLVNGQIIMTPVVGGKTYSVDKRYVDLVRVDKAYTIIQFRSSDGLNNDVSTIVVWHGRVESEGYMENLRLIFPEYWDDK